MRPIREPGRSYILINLSNLNTALEDLQLDVQDMVNYILSLDKKDETNKAQPSSKSSEG